MSAVSRRALLVAPMLAAPLTGHVAASTSDPILAAIAAARAASALLIERCNALHGDESDGAERACNAAADAMDRADKALSQVRPTTQAGLLALIEWYAEDAEDTDSGAPYLRRLANLLRPPAPS